MYFILFYFFLNSPKSNIRYSLCERRIWHILLIFINYTVCVVIQLCVHETVCECILCILYWSVVFLCNLGGEDPTGTHVNFDDNFSQHEYQINFQPFTDAVILLFRGIEQCGCLTLSVIVWTPLSHWICFLTCLLNFCLLSVSLVAWPGARCQTLRPCRCVTITALPLCVCVSALSKHTAGSPSPNLFTQVRCVVSVCVFACVCFYHHGAHLSSLPSANLEGRV